MAIWVTEDRASPGPVFGHKDYFKGLGVFIDTYKNHRPGTVFPYVMAMLGNGTEKYDKDNDGKDSELAGCSVWSSMRSFTPMFREHADTRTGEGDSRSVSTYETPNDLLSGAILQS